MVVIVSMAAFRSFSFHISLGNGYVHFPKGRSLAISQRQPLNASSRLFASSSSDRGTTISLIIGDLVATILGGSVATTFVGAATDAIFLGDDTNSATFCNALARSPPSVVTSLAAV